jgi:integrase
VVIIRQVEIANVSYDFAKEDLHYNLLKSYVVMLRRAEIKDFKFLNLRHMFASQLEMEGVCLAIVRELLEHKILAMTLRYSYRAPSHRVKTVDLLDSKMNEVCEKDVNMALSPKGLNCREHEQAVSSF